MTIVGKEIGDYMKKKVRAKTSRLSKNFALSQPEESNVPAPTFLDLFCGCGGFTLGMLRAGFNCLAAIDLDSQAMATFRVNLVDGNHRSLATPVHALERDLTKFAPDELARLIGTNHVDVIVGGPPCQGFSTARKVGGANHGTRLKEDPRRHLYREFLRYVEFFKPRVFVMENVLGLRTAAGGEYFTQVQKEARELGKAAGGRGYRVHGQIEDAWELGVPQKRRRQLIIGVRNDLIGYFPPRLSPAPRAKPCTLLGAAIGDLPVLRAGGGGGERAYDIPRREQHLRTKGATARNYLFKVLEVRLAKKLKNHVARPHSERDLRDFALLREGENSATAMRDRSVEFEFPYDKSSFKDRYTRQSRWQPCSTIVAHLSKDGLMFIHPTQNRSLTPREAARIQSFPDWYNFPTARTHAFRLIGNAVPPLVGEAVGIAVKDCMRIAASLAMQSAVLPKRHRVENWRRRAQAPQEVQLPTSRSDAAVTLGRLATLDQRQLRALPTQELLNGWHSLLFLFPDLHPNNALDHGGVDEAWLEAPQILPLLESNQHRRYARSSWPIALELIGLDAWRRYRAKELTAEDLYCTPAQRAGLLHMQEV